MPESPQLPIPSHTVVAELKRLIKQSSHYLAGLVASLALGCISFPIFTRAFSVSEYGLIDLAQRILLLLTVVSKMGLQNAALRFYQGPHSETNTRYYSTMLLGTAFTSGAAAMLVLVAVGVTPKSIVDDSLSLVLCLLAVLVTLRALGSILCAFLRVEERTKAFNVVSTVTKAGSIATVCVLLMYSSRTAQTFFIGTIVAETLIVSLLVLSLLRRRLVTPTGFSPALFRAALSFGSPLVVYEFAFALLTSADRFLIRVYLGADTLGQYAVARGLSQYVNELLTYPLNFALLPVYFRLWREKGAETTGAFLTICMEAFVVIAVGILAVVGAISRDAVIVLASSKYSSVGGLVPLLVSGFLIYTTYVFLSAGLLIHGKTLTMAVVLLCSAAFNVGLNCILLPQIGLLGAAISMLLANTVCVLLLGRASFKLLPLGFNVRTFLKSLLAGAMTWAVVASILEGPTLAGVAVRCAFGACLYVGFLFLLEQRVRMVVLRLCSRVQCTAGFGREGDSSVVDVRLSK